MSHNILGNRFFNNRSEPAWHSLGINKEVMLTASAAAELLGGTYSVKKVSIPSPIKVAREVVKKDGSTVIKMVSVPSGFSWVVRGVLPEDNVERLLGVPVRDDYEIITPEIAVKLYDENVRDENGVIAPVETMAFLGNGERMFICTELPVQYDVNGDEIKTYLLFDNPMAFGDSIGVYVVTIRTVCQNTLLAGIAGACETRKVPHTKGSTEAVAKWLKGVYGKAVATTDELRAAYQLMADTQINSQQITWALEALYPMPKKPEQSDVSKRDLVDRFYDWETTCDKVEQTRAVVVDLFEGKGVGMDIPSSAWKFQNAVAELETWKEGKSTSSKVAALISGYRGNRIRDTFTLMQPENLNQFADTPAWQILKGSRYEQAGMSDN